MNEGEWERLKMNSKGKGECPRLYCFLYPPETSEVGEWGSGALRRLFHSGVLVSSFGGKRSARPSQEK